MGCNCKNKNNQNKPEETNQPEFRKEEIKKEGVVKEKLTMMRSCGSDRFSWIWQRKSYNSNETT